MKQAKKLVWEDNAHPRGTRLLQPLVVGMVSAVIIILFLVMGLMDLKRSENTLRGFMENHGAGLAGVLTRLTQENLNILIRAHQRDEIKTYREQGDEGFFPHKWLPTTLIEFGREIDKRWLADRLSETYLRKFATDNNLWLIAVLDKAGRTVFQSRALPLEVSATNLPPETRTNLIRQLSALKNIGFIALKRRDESGTIIIALNEEGQRYWSLKVAVEKALEKFGEVQGRGVVYIVVRDTRDALLGRTGVIPVPWKKGEIDRQELLDGKSSLLSNEVLYQTNHVLDVGAPLILNDKILGTIRLGLDLEGTKVILAENKRNLLFFLFFAIVITLSCLWFLYHTQNRHLARVLELDRRLQKAERLSALGQLAAGVAHEIRNPLNAISMASQRMKRDFVPQEVEKKEEFEIFTRVIRDEIRRLDGIIEEFLSFSRTRRLVFASFSLVELIEKMVYLLKEEAASQGVEISVNAGDSPFVIPMDMEKLQQAFLNFFKNALESMNNGGRIDVSINKENKDQVRVSITDNGCGMGPEEVSQIFSPEYTTKQKGLGLGLALAHEIIRGHGGEIRVFSRQGLGTQFDVLLPASRADQEIPGHEKTRNNDHRGWQIPAGNA
jgi:signal transduction histidine kinase